MFLRTKRKKIFSIGNLWGIFLRLLHRGTGRNGKPAWRRFAGVSANAAFRVGTLFFLSSFSGAHRNAAVSKGRQRRFRLGRVGHWGTGKPNAAGYHNELYPSCRHLWYPYSALFIYSTRVQFLLPAHDPALLGDTAIF